MSIYSTAIIESSTNKCHLPQWLIRIIERTNRSLQFYTRNRQANTFSNLPYTFQSLYARLMQYNIALLTNITIGSNYTSDKTTFIRRRNITRQFFPMNW